MYILHTITPILPIINVSICCITLAMTIVIFILKKLTEKNASPKYASKLTVFCIANQILSVITLNVAIICSVFNAIEWIFLPYNNLIYPAILYLLLSIGISAFALIVAQKGIYTSVSVSGKCCYYSLKRSTIPTIINNNSKRGDV